MLVHHYDQEKHHFITVTTSNGSYCIKEIVQSLTYEQRQYLLFCHAFTGCDTVSSFHGFSKEKLYERLCSGNLRPLIDVFYNDRSSKVQILEAGIEIIQFIYKSQVTPLSMLRVNKYNKQSKAGVLKPENLPPIDGAARQHSLRAYLQLQDWLVLQSMSRDPKEYGWYLISGGAYEPILITDDIAPANLLKFASCNCSGNCSTKRCPCKKNNVKCISACGTCHGNQCKNIDAEVTDTNEH